MQTRRDFLKVATMLSGAVGISGVFPDSIQRAYAIAPDPDTTWLDAEHIVILMQENRSFDHVYGMLRGVRGFNDPRSLRLPNGNTVFVQTDKDGQSYAPWRLDIHDTRATWMGSLPHSRESQVDAWNEGRHDRWIEAKRSGEKAYAHMPMTMGHYTREDIPFYYSLADAFTVCDQNYCSVLSSTSPNRCYMWTGTIREQQDVNAKVHIRNEEIDNGGLTWKTFPERLQQAGVSWKIYQNELTRSSLTGEHDAWLSNFGDNTIECFNAYNVEASPAFAVTAQRCMDDLTTGAQRLEATVTAAKAPAEEELLRLQLKMAQNSITRLKSALADCGIKRYRQLTAEQKALFDAAFVTNVDDPGYHELESLPFTDNGKEGSMKVPKGDVFHQFRKDVNEGKLPTVSWLVAPENFSDHPASPWYGAWYVSETMNILTENPEVWKKTIFILTYDENDGYFDHAPSFVAADPKRPWTGGASTGVETGLDYTYINDELELGVAPQDARTGPIGLGFRVPMVIASPWSRGGWVNSQIFDHTSMLMLLEQFVQSKFGKTIREENITDWRRTVVGDLTSAFRPYDPSEADLDYLNRDKFVVSIQKSRFKEIPSNYRQLSSEEIARINLPDTNSALVPHQESGVRRACALPYELYAEAVMSPDGKALEIQMTADNKIHGSNAAGAPFNIYLRNLKPGVDGEVDGMRVATYALRSGDTLIQPFPLEIFKDEKYEVEVHGPNGFYRSFSGSETAQSLQVYLEYEASAGRYTGNVRVHLHNIGNETLEATIADNSYNTGSAIRSMAPGSAETVALRLGQSHHWYDFTVKAADIDTALRFAGHVETGRPGLSDPLMGNMT